VGQGLKGLHGYRSLRSRLGNLLRWRHTTLKCSAAPISVIQIRLLAQVRLAARRISPHLDD
jgi:hypothetical protein